MRVYCTATLKKQFRLHLLRSRSASDSSQEEMAHRLRMSCRSYADLEHGKVCCSAVTLMLYLVYICPDPAKFLAEYRESLERSTTAV